MNTPTYADIERMQFVLSNYIETFGAHMSAKERKRLENLQIALIAVRAQMEKK